MPTRGCVSVHRGLDLSNLNDFHWLDVAISNHLPYCRITMQYMHTKYIIRSQSFFFAMYIFFLWYSFINKIIYLFFLLFFFLRKKIDHASLCIKLFNHHYAVYSWWQCSVLAGKPVSHKYPVCIHLLMRATWYTPDAARYICLVYSECLRFSLISKIVVRPTIRRGISDGK